MAVSPALTYPSKTWRLGTDANIKTRVYTVWTERNASRLHGAVPPAGRIAAPRLFYRSVPAAQMTDPSLHQRALLVVNRRTTLMVASLIRMRGFPVPYLARVTTRPPYGEQWPRFAQYGSTM